MRFSHEHSRSSTTVPQALFLRSVVEVLRPTNQHDCGCSLLAPRDCGRSSENPATDPTHYTHRPEPLNRFGSSPRERTWKFPFWLLEVWKQTVENSIPLHLWESFTIILFRMSMSIEQFLGLCFFPARLLVLASTLDMPHVCAKRRILDQKPEISLPNRYTAGRTFSSPSSPSQPHEPGWCLRAWRAWTYMSQTG